ncbi:MAG TPA: hypothetical protein VFR10_03035 [bacterium]|nr:hypothetical protein [bacterium]
MSDAPFVSSRRWRVAACALAAAVQIAFIVTSIRTIDGRPSFTLFDDAMVSMRYARNLAHGDGLVWNPGEAPVEGYTNLLWTLVLAALHAAKLPEGLISLAVMIVGSALLIATVRSTSLVATYLLGGGTAVIAAILTAIYYPLIFWTLRGLEVGLLAFLVIEATRIALQMSDLPLRTARIRWSILLGCALLTRTDAMIPVAILLVWGFRQGSPILRRSVVVPVALICAGVLAAHTAFRLAYYGDILPNTYYLKMTGRPLLERVREGAIAFAALTRVHLWPLLAIVATGAAINRSLRGNRGAQLLGALFFGQAFYSIFAGGDSWEWMDFSNRFLCIALPGMFVLAGASIDALAPKASRRVPPTALVGGCTILLAALLNFSPMRIWLTEGAFHVSDDARMVHFAREIRACTKEDATVGVVWAGTVPYHVQRTCIDLLGKNDRVVAHGPVVGRYHPGHDKWNARHSIGELHPDVVAQTSLVWQEPGFWELVREEGYQRLGNGILARRGSERIDAQCLQEIQAPNW